jgi:DNA-binding GntR family transcriptional regulator
VSSLLLGAVLSGELAELVEQVAQSVRLMICSPSGSGVRACHTPNPPSPMITSRCATRRLGVSARSKSVLRRENVFYAHGDPVNRVTTYVPWTIARDTGLLQVEVPHQFGIHGILEGQHHVMTRIREEVSTRMPKPEETRQLHLRPGVPMLDVWHISIDQDGQPYELTRFVIRGDMTGLLYDVRVE